ncbi:acyl-CoA N-acyltransferase [Trichoderma sp. SZMC 28015]
MASVTIRPASPADAPAIAAVHYRAQEKYHGFYGAFFVHSPRDILIQATARAIQKPENVYLVAVDEESNKVVGFVRYVVEEEKKEEQQEEEAAVVSEGEEAGPPSLFGVKEHLKGLWEEFNEKQVAMDGCYEKAADGKRHIYVNHLMIDPDYQRKGIGGKLLAAVLARSDEEKVPTFLMSSAESRGLYGKMGFEILGTWRVDNGDWAGRVVELERGLGIIGREGLEEEFRGVGEVEDVMVRRVR